MQALDRNAGGNADLRAHHQLLGGILYYLPRDPAAACMLGAIGIGCFLVEQALEQVVVAGGTGEEWK